MIYGRLIHVYVRNEQISKQSMNPYSLFTASILCLYVSIGPYLFMVKSKGFDGAMQTRKLA